MKKKLTRSLDKKIGGVCGGIAEYLEADPTLIRVLYAALVLIYGIGFLLYFVLWIIMPLPEQEV